MHIDQPSLILASRWKTTKKFKSRAAFLASSCSVPSWADGGEHQRIFWISLYIELLKGTHCWWDLAQNSATEQPGNSAAGIWQSMVKNLQFKTQVESKNVQMRDHSAGLQIKLKDLNVLRFLIHLDSFEATQIQSLTVQGSQSRDRMQLWNLLHRAEIGVLRWGPGRWTALGKFDPCRCWCHGGWYETWMALVIGNVGDVPHIFGSSLMFLLIVCIRKHKKWIKETSSTCFH